MTAIWRMRVAASSGAEGATGAPGRTPGMLNAETGGLSDCPARRTAASARSGTPTRHPYATTSLRLFTTSTEYIAACREENVLPAVRRQGTALLLSRVIT